MFLKLAAVAFAITLTATAAQAGPVEIIGTIPSYDADVQAKLAATGRFSSVNYFDASAGTPDAANLASYSSVLIYSDAGFADPTTLGNNLDAYLRAGGGVVVAMFAVSDGGYGLTSSSFANDFAINPTASQGGTDLHLGAINIPTDPLLAGVNSFDNGRSGFYNASGVLAPGAIDVADYSNGVPLVAKTTVGGYETVNLNFYPVSSDVRSDFWNASTDGTTLLANALQVVGAQTSVPEPATLTLLGSGLAALAMRRRRIA